MKKILITLIVAVIIFSNSSKAGADIPKLNPTFKNIELLAKAMYAENGSMKNDDAVILTGIVVCQRVRAKCYPNTIKSVLSQKGQYSTWSSGRIQNCQPDERCYEIAEEILRFKLYKNYPHNLVFQSMFPQGKKTYRKISGEYFCLA